MKFTDRSIQTLKAQEKRYIVWKESGEGLGVRISAKGRKSFIFMYRFDGRARMLTLGDYPKMSLSAANLAHSQAADDLKHGRDPGTAKVKGRKAERDAETVKELASEYMEKWAKPRKRTWRKDHLIIEKDILPEWQWRKAKDITRRDVSLILDKILKREAPIQANRTLAVIRKMFNFAISRDIAPTNPCAGIGSPSPEVQRDRVLTEGEIKVFWEKLEETDMHPNTRNAYKLMLLTGQRIGEVVSSRWTEVDLKNAWWVIPAGKSKNKLQHRVPLNPQCLDVIEDIQGFSPSSSKKPEERGYLFPSYRGDQHINGTVIARALKRNMKLFNIAEFKPHDLRRTAASHMTGMGISRLVVSKILNHAESHITAVYDRHSYDAEKRRALDAWGNKLMGIIEADKEQVDRNVVCIKQAK